MKLYHVTTEKKAKKYRQTGHIIKPVRYQFIIAVYLRILTSISVR